MIVTVAGWPARVPFPCADYVVVEGTCPTCGAVPFRAQGGAASIGRDTYTARARCIECDADVSPMIAQISTIFGVEEDERVLQGPWRVY